MLPELIPLVAAAAAAAARDSGGGAENASATSLVMAHDTSRMAVAANEYVMVMYAIGDGDAVWGDVLRMSALGVDYSVKNSTRLALL